MSLGVFLLPQSFSGFMGGTPIFSAHILEWQIRRVEGRNIVRCASRSPKSEIPVRGICGAESQPLVHPLTSVPASLDSYFHQISKIEGGTLSESESGEVRSLGGDITAFFPDIGSIARTGR
jgi:hypothetical protein